ncbi:MAG: formate dehydrogenase subunit alpha [Gammaproteobacteria bacterium]|nr:MAG: formate dehydrogenase subunit alpha [Gammaproteobacteria bacterium]
MSNIAYINGQAFTIYDGETLYQFVSRHAGDEIIPVLCNDDALEAFGSCRLCSVEVAREENGPRRTVASCHTLVQEGQYIYPDSSTIQKLRRTILELLLSDFPEDALIPVTGEKATPFQDIVRKNGISASRFPRNARPQEVDKSHPYIHFDPAQCIHCYRCIRACDEIQGEFVLAMHGRGYRSRVIASLDQNIADSECVSCGRCVQTCPTNALTDRYRAKTFIPDKTVRTVCTYCGVGCNLEIMLKDGEIHAINAVDDAEVNQGHCCLKGRYAFSYYNHPDRLTTPLIRRDGKLQAASWDEVLDTIASRLEEIKNTHGHQSIAGISSSRCTNEENYLMQKFMRVVIGNNNIDGCARVCHAPTAFGMRQAFGTGAATNSIQDIASTDCMLVVGANSTEAHPVTGAKIQQQVIKGVSLIVIDPRKIELTRYATVHLQLRPGTNVALLDMFIYYILSEELVDNKFVAQRTEGFEEFRHAALAVDIDQLGKITGVEHERVREAALLYGQARNAMSFHGLGLTEHYQGSRAVMLLSALAMLTGNIGRPGVGVNPLRGQNNVQGAADMGVQPKLGAGYLDVTDETIRQHYEKHYGRPVPAEDGLTTPEMINAAHDGKLKALLIMGEDILQTDPHSGHVRSSIENLDFLVVMEIFMTETASLAHVVLPACSHLEKSGTFTNGERRIQRVNQVLPPLEDTRSDGQILVDLMNRMGYPQKGYDPDILLQEISRVVPFFAGVKWNELGDNGKQWPVREDGTDTKVLHTDQFTRGKGKFVFTRFHETPELQGDDISEYPLILTTGRRLQHYNCGSMTRRTPNVELVDRDELLLNPFDAARYRINNNDNVEVRSRQGTTHLRARISDDVKPGVLFTTFHFPEVAINQLTSGVLDLDAKTPEFKVTAVAIGKLEQL